MICDKIKMYNNIYFNFIEKKMRFTVKYFLFVLAWYYYCVYCVWVCKEIVVRFGIKFEIGYLLKV